MASTITHSLVRSLTRRVRLSAAHRRRVRRVVGYVAGGVAVWLSARAAAGLSAGWWSVLAAGCVGAAVVWLLLSRRPQASRRVVSKPRGERRVVSVDQVPELRAEVADDRAEWERVMSSILGDSDDDDDDEPEYNVTVYPSKGSRKVGPGEAVSRLSDSR